MTIGWNTPMMMNVASPTIIPSKFMVVKVWVANITNKFIASSCLHHTGFKPMIVHNEEST